MSFLGLGMGGTGKVNAGGNPAMDQHPIQGGVEILLIEFVCALDNHNYSGSSVIVSCWNKITFKFY